jgi:hypothetical protein
MGIFEAEYERMVKEVKAKTTSTVDSIPEGKTAAFMKHFRNHQKIYSNAEKHILKIFNVNKNGHCFGRCVVLNWHCL